MKPIFKGTGMAVIAAVGLAFVAGCGDADAGKHDPSAARLAALEKDVSSLRGEVRVLRHQLERDAKVNSRPAMDQLPHRQNRSLPYVRSPEDLRNPRDMRSGESPQYTPVMRKDPAKMTPEERRAWHEERRRMREARRRVKTSESENQTNPEPQKEGKNK